MGKNKADAEDISTDKEMEAVGNIEKINQKLIDKIENRYSGLDKEQYKIAGIISVDLTLDNVCEFSFVYDSSANKLLA